jgi:protein-S-isoprenylcysteine O-methyltransferase Ste14
MNSIGLTGMALVVLGLAGVFSTAAATAAIPAVFGLVFLALALRARRPDRARSSGAAAAVVAALGILAAAASIVPRLLSGTLTASVAFATLCLAAVCALYLAAWAWERAAARGGPAV